ncbi:MAG: HD domain-containing protein [Candidatus Hodarchaeales archaeon]|jgi:uncharacterized protein
MVEELKNQRILSIANFVHDHLITKFEEQQQQDKKLNPEGYQYRWQHTLRVGQYGKRIAKLEGANEEIVVASCLLHDVSHFDGGDYKNHGRLSSKIARKFLKKLDYSQEEVNSICYAVAVHVDGKADFDHPKTLEAGVVSDSDNIDRFGALSIVQRCIPDINNYDILIENSKKAITRYQKYLEDNILETKTGNELFRKQLERYIEFLKALIDEKELTVLPKI